jgi:hypothetical protein
MSGLHFTDGKGCAARRLLRAGVTIMLAVQMAAFTVTAPLRAADDPKPRANTGASPKR